jgi:hypothetical protein
MHIIRIALLLAVCALAGCVTYNGAPVYGRTNLVSASELSSAVSVVLREFPDTKIFALRVVSANEIWLYFTQNEQNFFAIHRSRGRWTVTGPGSSIILDPPRDGSEGI